MKLFNSFKAAKKLINETEFVKIYKLIHGEKEYKIIITKRFANKHTIIHFTDNTIFWEQIPHFPRLAGRPYGDKFLNTLFVVKGSPLGDEGLDDGIFRSPKRYNENFVNCMTYKKFKNM